MRNKKVIFLCMLLCISSFAVSGYSKKDNGGEKNIKSNSIPESKDTSDEISAYDLTKSNYKLTVDASNHVHEISDLLYGIFFEDINFAADGGLYAELVQNRSFEFTELAKNDEMHGWNVVGDMNAAVTVDDLSGSLNRNNTNYLVMENASVTYAGVANRGFLNGMAVFKNQGYQFSIYAKGFDGYTGALKIDIMVNGTSVASGNIPSLTSKWEKYKLSLTPSVTANTDVTLQVTMEKGKCAIDMVSLFPEDTYKGREKGLRKDLAEKLMALKPKFLRFPGGCVIEGVSLPLAYDWKNSIGVDENREPFLFHGTYGDVAARSQGQNIWTNEHTTNDPYPSFMSYGLGFYEYFQLAEDIGAIGVPVINAGMCCMAQSDGSGPAVGTAEFERYIQDALDLVEFCRGDSSTKWGAVRIAMGHPEPFKLKYIGIGNEQWGDEFFRHYQAFVDAFAQARIDDPVMYGDIELMFSAGVDDGDSGHSMYMDAYDEAYQWLQDNPGRDINEFAGAIDHHYYNEPSWFLRNANYYDEENYSRNTENMTKSRFGGGIHVFLGEYAAKSNTLKAALAEAAYMTGLERNGDIVKMAAYAPLFGNLTATHWAPDLIWFNNHQSTSSINYYVQQIFLKNAGTTLLESSLEGALLEDEPFKGKVGVGTWNTAAKFDNINITDNETGQVLASQDFEKDTLHDWEQVSDGNWSIENGELVQSSTSTNTTSYSTTGTAAYFGDRNWRNYTYTLEAAKISGKEGFLIPFSVGDKNDNYFWNIGGWNNTVSCLQSVSGGIKSDKIGGTTKNFAAKTNQTYQLKIVVTDKKIKCYIDNELYVDYSLTDSANAEAYQVVSTDSSGDIIIKMVNVTGDDKVFAINLENADIKSDTAKLDVVAGTDLSNDNILGKKPVVKLESSSVKGITNQFNYTAAKYSVTVMRVKTK